MVIHLIANKLSQDYRDQEIEWSIDFKNALYYNKDLPNNLQYSTKTWDYENLRNDIASEESVNTSILISDSKITPNKFEEKLRVENEMIRSMHSPMERK